MLAVGVGSIAVVAMCFQREYTDGNLWEGIMVVSFLTDKCFNSGVTNGLNYALPNEVAGVKPH